MRMKSRYSARIALKEHMLSGGKITVLEASTLFGEQSLSALIYTLKKDGFIIKKQSIPLARVVRRMNQFCVFTPPKNLPVIELKITEWWIQID